MFSVALIGADGAGKTTICRRLEAEQPLPIKYIYMGVSKASSNHALPTTRLIQALKRALGQKTAEGGPPDPTRVKARPRGLIKRALFTLKAMLRLANLLGEEWYRQSLSWFYQHRGYVALYDRHFFFDYYAYDIANDDSDRSLTSRIHGFFLRTLYPKPDMVILLDAPAEILLARKGEGTLDLLESRRQEYQLLRDEILYFMVVDVSQPEDVVLAEVTEFIYRFYQTVTKRQMKVRDV